MSQIRCLTCNTVVSPSALASGWCQNCGEKLTVHAASPYAPPPGLPISPTPSYGGPPAPTPPFFGVPPRPTRRPWAGLVVVVLLILCVAGVVTYFALRPNVLIYVDNTGAPDEIIVSVDGSETIVPADSVGVVKCRSGSRRITARRGGRIVFDQSKTLQSKKGEPQKYLLDSGAAHHYWVHKVRYGFEVPSMNYYYDEVDHYRKIADQIERLKPAEWTDANPDYVFERPPSEVKATLMSSRTVIQRLSSDDYDRLEAAGQKKKLEPGDIDQITAAVDRILKSEP